MTTMTAPPLPPPAPVGRRVTPEELLELPDRNRYELVNGQLEERPVSSESSRIGARIVHLLSLEAGRTGSAVVYGADLGYRCFHEADDPDLVRKPDASVLRIQRWLTLPGDPGDLRVPADLAVEVISPNELHRAVIGRVDQYLAADFGCVWVADVPTRTVHVYRSDGSVARLRPGDTITGEAALPGFTARVADLFLSPARPPAVPAGTA